MKPTLVLGASVEPSRYSNMAAKRLMEHGHAVTLVGKVGGEINGVPIQRSIPLNEKIDTVTLYVNPGIQKLYYDDIIKLKPKRIIFNPGAENEELKMMAEKNGIFTEEACTLTLLAIGGY